MMMTLGLFVFSLRTIPYAQLRRTTSARIAANTRIGRRPARQFLGPGDDKITLSGELHPELTGGPSNLDTLRRMMLGGKAWRLLDGNGEVLGVWSIDSVNQTDSRFLEDGTARKIGFDLSLTREPDDTLNLAELDIATVNLA